MHNEVWGCAEIFPFIFSTRHTLIARLMSVNMEGQTQDLHVRSFVRKAEHELPGYSYDLKPIEMVFGQAKAIARFTPGFLKENTMLAIVSAFEQISPLNVRHFYQRSWRVLL